MQPLRRLAILCRGDTERILPWLDERDPRWLLTCAATIVVGCGFFGFTMGYWRAPLQAVYTAIKLPLLIFLTCGANSLLNGLLAQILGSGLSFRQTSLMILMSFTISATTLGALSPVAFFICLNTPHFAHGVRATGHNVMILSSVFFIAYAGVAANRRLLELLGRRCGNTRIARNVLFCWLAGNLFLGAQITWLIRPFVGTGNPTVTFFADNPLEGNFYEAVFHAFFHINQ